MDTCYARRFFQKTPIFRVLVAINLMLRLGCYGKNTDLSDCESEEKKFTCMYSVGSCGASEWSKKWHPFEYSDYGDGNPSWTYANSLSLSHRIMY